MAYKVELSGPAEVDLGRIADYLTHNLHNKKAAMDFLDEFECRLDDLESQPRMFPEMTETLFAQAGFRYFPVKNYLGIYRIIDADKAVIIVRILHCRQDHLRWL
jgi:plasmid stabilization system protein ParE